MSSNPNLRSPEGDAQGHQGEDTSSARPESEWRPWAGNDIAQPSNFPPTVLPFRQPSHLSGTSREGDSTGVLIGAHGPPDEAGGRGAPDPAPPHAVDVLGIRGWETIKVEYTRGEIVVRAKLLTVLTHCRCKKCAGACRSTNFKRHGQTRIQKLQHTPVDGWPRRIEYRRQTYFCKDCKHTSKQPVPGVYQGTNMTRRLRRYIARQSIMPQVSFSSLAEEVGRSERSVRAVFEKHLAHLESIRGIETPRVMGMDGVYIKRQEALIVTDIEHRRVVMIKPSIKERAVADALREMPDRDKVEEVVADMAGGLDRVQREVVPKAIRIKDRYHVQRKANEAVDFVRRALHPGWTGQKKGESLMCPSHLLRKRKHQLDKPKKGKKGKKGEKDKKDEKGELAALEWCLGLYPELKLTYELKELHCDFWNSLDEETALVKDAEWFESHARWKRAMPKDLRGAFDPLIKLMRNWREDIFNYFRARRTNAYTESANAGVKRLTSKAPRAKFRTVSGKIVHGTRRKQHLKAIRRRGKGQRPPWRALPPAPAPASTIHEELQGNEEQSPSQTPDCVPMVKKELGPRIDLARITSPKRGSKEGEDSAPPSAQMSLFE